jgi:hypothetical protein
VRSLIVIAVLVLVAWVMEAEGAPQKGMVPLPPAYPAHVRPAKPERAVKPKTKAKKEKRK